EALEWGASYERSDYVFARPDGSVIRPDSLSRRFRQAAKQAGLPAIRFHDLRHTSASLALAAGVPMRVVSDRLGHSTTAITADLYTHVVPSVAREAAEAIAGTVATAGHRAAERDGGEMVARTRSTVDHEPEEGHR